MSANPADNEMNGSAPIQPPKASNPLLRLVVPACGVVLLIYLVVYGVVPWWKMLCTADENIQKMREDSVRAYSRPYYPGNNSNGPFAPTKP